MAENPEDLKLSQAHEYARRGNLPALMDLVEKGDIKVKNTVFKTAGTLGNTSLMWAASAGHLDVVNYCLKNGADVNHPNDVNDTALHLASWRGYTDIAKSLLDAGADTSLKNKDFKTPYDLAREEEMKHLLVKADSSVQITYANSDDDDDE